MTKFVVCTSMGALGAQDGKHGDPNHKRGLSDDRVPWVNNVVSDGASMLEVAKEFKPTCLLGLAAQDAGLFDEELVRTVAAQVDRPIVMPMSNPTSKSECTPEQAYRWTDGRAVVATGSPFDPVELNGKTHIPSQCNNMYIFPGIGLAASVAGTKMITDTMFYKAAVACMETMTEEEKEEGRTFPVLSRIRDVSHAVACAVIREGFEQGLNTKLEPEDFEAPGVLEHFVDLKMYNPHYVPLVNKDVAHH